MFSNCIFFNTKNLLLDGLADKLATRLFSPCPDSVLGTSGWTSPAGEGSEIVRKINGYSLLSFCTDEKSVPNAFVAAQLKARCADYFQRKGAEPSKEEQAAMEDNIIDTLTSKLIPARKETYVLISPDLNWIAINVSSAKRAERIIRNLQDVFGGFKAAPFKPSKQTVSVIMTRWLTNKSMPEDMMATGDCILDDGDSERVTYKNGALFDEPAQSHLGEGKRVIKMGLFFKEQVSFKLDTSLILSGIKYAKELHPENNSEADQDDLVAAKAYFIDESLLLVAPVIGELYDFLTTFSPKEG